MIITTTHGGNMHRQLIKTNSITIRITYKTIKEELITKCIIKVSIVRINQDIIKGVAHLVNISHHLRMNPHFQINNRYNLTRGEIEYINLVIMR